MNDYTTDKIRSVALVGHGGCGKTSIAEAMALLVGQNTRLGSVTDQTSLMDFEAEEQKRGGSITTSYLTGEYDGHKIHVADTPGDGNFLHDAFAAMQAVDAAVIVVSAVDGVEVSTEHVNGYAKNLDLPRTVFINKMDRENSDYKQCLADISEVLGLQPVLMQIPIGTESNFRGIVDLIAHKAFLYEGDSGKATEAEIPADMHDAVEAALEQMMEAVAASDDELIEKYLEEGELTQDELRHGLHDGILNGSVVPVALGSATLNIGVDRLLNMIKQFPAADQRPPKTAHHVDEPDEVIRVPADADGPVMALCVKTMIDRVGTVSVFRLVSGTVHADDSATNVRTGEIERFGKIFHLIGHKRENITTVRPGDLFCAAKLRDTITGDTLGVAKSEIALDFAPPPPAMIAYTVRPKSRGDIDKLKSALDKLVLEDPALRQDQDSVSSELVLAGMGAVHVQLAVEKMSRKYGVNVELGMPSIPYRETIQGSADVRYRHKKQTGGAGQFGEVAIRVRPSERGEGFQFLNVIKGGVIPNSLIPSVEKGARLQLDEGVLAGFPVIDVTVELYDGKYHPVDSKDIAFQIAGRQAIKEAVMKCRPALLEPIYSVDIVVPEEQVGDVMGDMNTRRGRILNMESRGRNSVVKALVPLAEMLNYAPDLRSMTGGKGSYTMQFSAYETVPAHMQDQVVADLRAAAEGD